MAPPRHRSKPPVRTIFVGREGPQRVFERDVFAIPQNKAKILAFYGPGGQGKTALCRELYRKTSSEVDPAYRFLRRGEINFQSRTLGDPDLLFSLDSKLFCRSRSSVSVLRPHAGASLGNRSQRAAVSQTCQCLARKRKRGSWRNVRRCSNFGERGARRSCEGYSRRRFFDKND